MRTFKGVITMEDTIVALTLEDGSEAQFELLEIIEFQTTQYAVLVGIDARCTGCMILEVEKIIDDTMSFYPVPIEIANQVFEIFKEHAKDLFTFES